MGGRSFQPACIYSIRVSIRNAVTHVMTAVTFSPFNHLCSLSHISRFVTLWSPKNTRFRTDVEIAAGWITSDATQAAAGNLPLLRTSSRHRGEL